MSSGHLKHVYRQANLDRQEQLDMIQDKAECKQFNRNILFKVSCHRKVTGGTQRVRLSVFPSCLLC